MEEKMTYSKDDQRRQHMNGCGWTMLGIMVTLAVGLVAAVIYVLVSFGSWLWGL